MALEEMEAVWCCARGLYWLQTHVQSLQIQLNTLDLGSQHPMELTLYISESMYVLGVTTPFLFHWALTDLGAQGKNERKIRMASATAKDLVWQEKMKLNKTVIKFMERSDIRHELGSGSGMFHSYLNSIYPQIVFLLRSLKVLYSFFYNLFGNFTVKLGIKIESLKIC